MSNFTSLIFYIIIYAVSAILFSFHKNKNIAIRYLCVFFSILIPSILAGLRYNVGTDYRVYNWNMTYIRNVPLKDVFLNNTALGNTEYGFLLLTKLLTYLGSNKVVFGIIAFVMLSFVIVALIRDYKEYYISVGYFMYLFIYFTSSLNIVRQGLALAIVFWGHRYVLSHQLKKYIAVVLGAALFHYSALIAFPVYFFWNHKRNRAINNRNFSVILIVSSFIIIFWRKIYVFAVNMGFSWIKKYEGYLKNNSAKNRDFYVKLLFLVLIFIFYMYSKMKNEKVKLYIQMYLLNMIIAFTGFYITFVKRLGLYYEIPSIILVSVLPKGFDKKSRYIVLLLSAIAVIMYFTLVFYIVGDSEIIPYQIK